MLIHQFGDRLAEDKKKGKGERLTRIVLSPRQIFFALFVRFARIREGEVRAVGRGELERCAAQVEVALGEGDFNARLFEKSPDAIVDIAFDLRVAARPVRPDEQAKVE